MAPALEIILGLFFVAGGGFVVLQGLRMRRMSSPWPKFFLVAFAIHIAILALGLGLVAKGLYTMSGA
jgi:hypothetical protein